MPSLRIQKGELNSRSYLPIVISPDPPNRIRWENDNMDFSSDLLKHALSQGRHSFLELSPQVALFGWVGFLFVFAGLFIAGRRERQKANRVSH